MVLRLRQRNARGWKV